jgi:hypothetical protein
MSRDDLYWCEIKTTRGSVKVQLQSFYLEWGIIKLSASIYNRFPLIYGADCSINILRNRSMGSMSGAGVSHFPISELLGTVDGVVFCSFHAPHTQFNWELYPSTLWLAPRNITRPSDINCEFGRNARSSAADWNLP